MTGGVLLKGECPSAGASGRKLCEDLVIKPPSAVERTVAGDTERGTAEGDPTHDRVAPADQSSRNSAGPAEAELTGVGPCPEATSSASFARQTVSLCFCGRQLEHERPGSLPAQGEQSRAEADSNGFAILPAIETCRSCCRANRGSEVELAASTQSPESPQQSPGQREEKPFDVPATTVLLSPDRDDPLVKEGRRYSKTPGYSPVDAGAAQRLAKRLYNLEGFKRSDVIRHLSKNNDFTRLVADEYLHYFDFSGLTLVEAMRAFFGLHPLPLAAVHSQEQQCIVAHVARRYAFCNPSLEGVAGRAEDACRTLACAIVLLNANLHGQNGGKKIALSEFVRDVQSLHGGYSYSESLLKSIYLDMQLEALNHQEDSDEGMQELLALRMHVPTFQMPVDYSDGMKRSSRTDKALLQVSKLSNLFEYKRGYVRRKRCKGVNGARMTMGKRSWKTVFAVLRGTTLRMAESESAYDRDSIKGEVSIDNALAEVASDYKKSECVLRLQMADRSEYLMQTGDSLDLEDWVEVINLVAASMSCSAEPQSSCTDFRRGQAVVEAASKGLVQSGTALGQAAAGPPANLFGDSTELNLKGRLKEHDWRAGEIEHELRERRSRQSTIVGNGSRAFPKNSIVDNEESLLFELKRRRIYSGILKKKLAEFPELDTSFAITAIGECDEPPLSPRQLIGPTCVAPWGSL